MFYGFNPTWILLMVVSVALGGITQAYINSSFRRWSQVPLADGLTGAQVAARVLEANGIDASGYGVQEISGTSRPRVRIQAVGGNLSDNYDPRDKTLNLSEGVFGASTVSAAGVAAHEAGHAVQDAQGYVWGRLRGALGQVRCRWWLLEWADQRGERRGRRTGADSHRGDDGRQAGARRREGARRR